ncbi:histidine kinase [Hymenobacter sp.]|uniref:sensor histidine kinase n=1 Tax=Hymenobacter sp. TaxID=1898978 RepID=UPI00286AC8C4|nr:histidine kinase [Hymenobacter sp.]
MKNARFWRSRALRHGVVWLLVVIVCGLLGRQGNLRTMGLPYTALLLGVQAAAIYIHFWLLTHLLERRRYAWYALATLALVVAGAAGLDRVEQVERLSIVKMQLEAGGGPPTGAALRFAQNAANLVFALGLATVARYVRRGVVGHLQVQQLRALQLETELSLLKAQVNQHFLFNTLNNLYGLSLAAPEQMPEALLQLAGLMRYQLDSSRQSTVTVGTEAEYLANYIGLEKLRLRHNTRVEFRVNLPHPDQPLAPLLLLPLVENCFKHAIGPSGENTIRIELTQTDVGLTLHTGNSIPPHFRATPSGLGLPTLRARLAQYYPGPRHRLSVEATATFYAASLQLVL